MTRATLISLLQALCGLLALTDHKASRDLALLGICLANVHRGQHDGLSVLADRAALCLVGPEAIAFLVPIDGINWIINTSGAA